VPVIFRIAFTPAAFEAIAATLPMVWVSVPIDRML
jgi:hypothetical protein